MIYNKFLRACISLAIFLLLAVSIICLFCIIIIFVSACIDGNYSVNLSKEGVYNMQQFWLKYQYLIQIFGGSLSLFVVCYTLQRHIDTEAINALSNFREKMNKDEKIKLHSFLLAKSRKKVVVPELEELSLDDEGTVESSNLSTYKMKNSNAVILDYLGTIELGYLMVKKGLISLDEFNKQFGYRVRHILKNDDIKQYLERSKGRSYEDFKSIVDSLISNGFLKEKYKFNNY